MDLLVGLGNPGIQYTPTRHNFGFKAIERVACAYKITLNGHKNSSIYGEGIIAGRKVILVKPLTFMNDSGRAVGAWQRFYQLPLENILVMYDDIDLLCGRIRIRPQGSAGGHNGIKSLIDHLHSDEFPRIRLGIGPQTPGMDSADYVLSSFKTIEWETVNSVLDIIPDVAEIWLSKGTEAAMAQFNGFNGKQS